jgi:hypothetical protein
MLNMRESWTDERLDDFAKHVDHRFDLVDRRFEEIDRRFEEVDRRFDDVDRRLERLEDQMGGLQRAVIYGFIAMATVIVASNAALIGLAMTL